MIEFLGLNLFLNKLYGDVFIGLKVKNASILEDKLNYFRCFIDYGRKMVIVYLYFEHGFFALFKGTPQIHNE